MRSSTVVADLAVAALRAPVRSGLDDACGEVPSLLCEQVYDATGDTTLTGLADWIVDRPLTILLIVALAWIGLRVGRRVLERTIRRIVLTDTTAARRSLHALGIDRADSLLGIEEEEPALAARRESRAASITAVITSTVTVIVWTIALIMILGELGLDLAPIIAGAGIGGVAIGFGAQSLVKDCISGLFILMEDQYGIGDVVDLGEATGVVEEVALRTTVLRGLDGTVWHVPNGEIQRVGNKSQHWSTAVVDVDVAYDADLAQVRSIMAETAARVCADEEWSDDVLDEPQVLGVETLGADGITVRMTLKTAPGQQWAIQRALREALKSSLDSAGIEIPFPQRTLWLRNQDT
ncbi:mechanosensitive ion channel family protein [Ilumatobacter sp.]|uniref:mechanosensitive ion channel family protein n=1 Tax=Ilumatobacter sp. TaxID=1967498 RepID=UPI003B52ED76